MEGKQALVTEAINKLHATSNAKQKVCAGVLNTMNCKGHWGC